MIRLPVVWAFCLALLALVAASAADVEYRVKGGYLYNFTKFVEWPANAFSGPDAPIVIGILGDDPFGPEFDEAMKGLASQGGRPIKLRRIKRAEDAAGCHILFISRSEERRLPEILQHIRASTLTVGECARFARQGGIIEFVIVDGKVRFVINVDAERRAGLKISSELKRVAAEIVRGEREERAP
ncbi:MAG TPA: YfiR family protein [Planctomycetota bacterium]|jgi:hypothetical protein